MGVYNAAIITNGGQNLLAQAISEGKTLTFTSVKTSSYVYPSGTNIQELTGLQDIMQTVLPSNAQVINNNVAQITARFDNDEVTTAYFINTLGTYAQIDDGTEILFGVIRAITPDEMPVHSDVSPSAFIYNIQHTVQNAAQITITVNPAGAATVEDILAIENPEFDDSGSVPGIANFPDFLSKIVSKMNVFQFYRNLKAGLQFVLHAGQLVNNCTSTASNLPLAAAQGKVLMDLYTQLNSDLSNKFNYTYNVSNIEYVPEGARVITTYANPAGYPSGLGGNACMIIQNGADMFRVQLAFSFGSDKIAIRRKANSSEWTDWKYFTAS